MWYYIWEHETYMNEYLIMDKKKPAKAHLECLSWYFTLIHHKVVHVVMIEFIITMKTWISFLQHLFFITAPLSPCSACVLFVVQNGERNIFDQRPFEFELWKRYEIHIISKPLVSPFDAINPPKLRSQLPSYSLPTLVELLFPSKITLCDVTISGSFFSINIFLVY